MAKKETISTTELQKLCNFDERNQIYSSKSGEEYVEMLSKLFVLNNKNDIPFSVKDIEKQPLLKDFTFSGLEEYVYVCELIALPMTISKNGKRKNEKIVAQHFENNGEEIISSKLGVSYLITCPLEDGEHIVKIGQTRTTFRKRLQSYNCGCVYNWRTASTTNIKMLQSFLTTRKIFKLYICDCSDQEYVLEWHGVKSVPFASPKSLAVEDIMIKQFISIFKQKPLANIQTDATTIED